MKLAYVTAGAAGMYCGSCLTDNTLAKALIGLGHDVALMPVYTPIRTDEQDVSLDRVFFGAVNVYLEQKVAPLRRMPRFLDRWLSSRRVLDWAARKGASTDARDLGALTVSMLEGEEGHQRRELDVLVEWLRDEYRPDLVHLSNSLLLGMAREIRRALSVPVVCSVQGEDLYLDGLREPWATRVRGLLRERLRDADAFVVSSDYYGKYMGETLGLPLERVHRVPLGIATESFGLRTAPVPPLPFVVGYLARICPEKGLHLLLDAFRLLAERSEPGSVRLRIAGYLGPRDREYAREQEQRLRSWGLGESVDWVGELDGPGKTAFLDSLHVFSVPTVYREPKGRSVLEALASAVPVVQPGHGAFPEMLEATGGGLLFEPGSAAALADALARLAADRALREDLGRRGQAAVRRDFSAEAMARAMLQVYAKHLPRVPAS